MSEFEELFNSTRARYPELAGKVAVVTGSGKGIGKGIAIRLGREGMKVVLTARTVADIEEVAQELRSVGVEAYPVAGDIAKIEDIDRLFAECVRVYGFVDLLVNNAANLHRVPFFNVSPEMFADEMASNVTGPFYAAYKAAEMMKAKGGGSIVHISSVGGLRAHHPGLPYDATKGALDSMTRVMGIELIQHGIRATRSHQAQSTLRSAVRQTIPECRLI